MKTFTLALLFAVSLFHGGNAFANDNDDNDTKVAIAQSMSGEKKAVIRIDNLVKEQKTMLKIKDERGRILHSEVIHQAPTFIRSYDFSTVKGKTYTVEVVNKEGKTRKTFEIGTATEQVYFKPVIRTEAGVIKVVFQNPLDSPVSVKLYDRYNHLIYSNKVESQEVFAHGLDVSHLGRYDYELSVVGSGYAYSKRISTR
jgi:hypothetical protein